MIYCAGIHTSLAAFLICEQTLFGYMSRTGLTCWEAQPPRALMGGGGGGGGAGTDDYATT